MKAIIDFLSLLIIEGLVNCKLLTSNKIFDMSAASSWSFKASTLKETNVIERHFDRHYLNKVVKNL